MGILKEDINRWQARFRQETNGVRFYGFAEARKAMEKATPSAPVLGSDMFGRPVPVDLDSESPHVALSIASGGGKSVALKAMAAQLARSGAHVVVLDFKRHSHRWARHVPSITYCRDIEDIHETLQGIALEGRDRYKRADRLSDEEFESGEWKGQRIAIVVEELNAMMAELQDYWLETRPRGRGVEAPRRSPAVKSFHEILTMGRQANLNVLAVAQRLSTESLGGAGGYGRGADARENFAIRVLGRYTMNTWRMLVPEVEYEPASEHLGRVRVVRAGKAVETQVLYLSDWEAINWACGKEM